MLIGRRHSQPTDISFTLCICIALSTETGIGSLSVNNQPTASLDAILPE